MKLSLGQFRKRIQPVEDIREPSQDSGRRSNSSATYRR